MTLRFKHVMATHFLKLRLKSIFLSTAHRCVLCGWVENKCAELSLCNWGRKTRVAEGRFEGWVQEVDFHCEQRFHSGEELLKFMGVRFEICRAAAEKARADKERAITLSKKKPCKDEASS